MDFFTLSQHRFSCRSDRFCVQSLGNKKPIYPATYYNRVGQQQQQNDDPMEKERVNKKRLENKFASYKLWRHDHNFCMHLVVYLVTGWAKHTITIGQLINLLLLKQTKGLLLLGLFTQLFGIAEPYHHFILLHYCNL